MAYIHLAPLLSIGSGFLLLSTREQFLLQIPSNSHGRASPAGVRPEACVQASGPTEIPVCFGSSWEPLPLLSLSLRPEVL